MVQSRNDGNIEVGSNYSLSEKISHFVIIFVIPYPVPRPSSLYWGLSGMQFPSIHARTHWVDTSMLRLVKFWHGAKFGHLIKFWRHVSNDNRTFRCLEIWHTTLNFDVGHHNLKQRQYLTIDIKFRRHLCPINNNIFSEGGDLQAKNARNWG